MSVAKMNHEEDQQKKLLTRESLAAMLSVSLRKVDLMMAAGLTPNPLRLGARCVRFDPAEIRSWVQAGMPNRERWDEMKQE